MVPKGVRNDPDTLYRCVTSLLRSVVNFAPIYYIYAMYSSIAGKWMEMRMCKYTNFIPERVGHSCTSMICTPNSRIVYCSYQNTTSWVHRC